MFSFSTISIKQIFPWNDYITLHHIYDYFQKNNNNNKYQNIIVLSHMIDCAHEKLLITLFYFKLMSSSYTQLLCIEFESTTR